MNYIHYKIDDGAIIELKDATYKVVYHNGPLSCSVAGGMTLLVTNKDNTQQHLFLPPGYRLEEIAKNQNIEKDGTCEEKYNLFNPHPVETYKYSYRDMLDCWIAARENLVRWGVGEGDKPDFASWIKEYHSNKNKT